MPFSSLVFPLLLAAPAAAAAAPEAPEGLVIAFPKSAGQAEFAGVAIVVEHGRCRVKEPTGNPASDAFACNTGPRQRSKVDGQVYAMTWVPPRYQGRFVPASLVPVEAKPAPSLPGRVVAEGDTLVNSLITRVAIDTQGRVVECAIESSSGDAQLDRRICALDVAERRLPATLDGAPVEEVRYDIVKIRRTRVFTAQPL